jgi:hypothetical protein
MDAIPLRFLVGDPAGHVDAATLAINLAPVNDPPVVTIPPIADGAALVGQPMYVIKGAWSDATDGSTGPLTFTIRWQIADDATGTNATDIPGAEAETFTPGLADAGKYVRMVVTATDSGIGPPPSLSTTAASPWRLIKAVTSYAQWAAENFLGECRLSPYCRSVGGPR